jgi:ppGpp synthetase/RelA/SpoT-type nucleotidyltranferase
MAKRKAKTVPKPTPSRDFVEEYTTLEPLYRQFAQRVDSLLHELLNKRGISVHATEHRSKSIESFREKIQRPGKNYHNPLSELSDLAGNRVILYYQEDVESVREILHSEFNVDTSRSINKFSELGADQFGYNSDHFVVGLSSNRLTLPEWEVFKGRVTEIQVRTVLQHAWSAVSHSLQYKNEVEIPSSLRRRLNRLSGLFELADDEFSTLRKKRNELKAKISAQFTSQSFEAAFDTELNAISANEYLAKSKMAKSVNSLVNKHRPTLRSVAYDSISAILKVAQVIHVTSIHELDEKLRIVVQKGDKFFHLFAEDHKRRGVEAMGSVEHWCAAALAGAAYSNFTATTLRGTTDWSLDYCELILKTGHSVFS